ARPVPAAVGTLEHPVAESPGVQGARILRIDDDDVHRTAREPGAHGSPAPAAIGALEYAAVEGAGLRAGRVHDARGVGIDGNGGDDRRAIGPVAGPLIQSAPGWRR